MKLAFVTPRFGTEVMGGAENAARMLAERVHSQLGWEVEAYTSCAIDAATWANHYPPGEVTINGVRVQRFPVRVGRHENFLQTSAVVHANPRLAPIDEQQTWIDQQGPDVPALVDAVAASDADVFAFYPYLYYPTVRALPEVASRAVMHPAAHDEPSIRMSIFAPVFTLAQGFVFHTDGERRLVERLFPVADRPQLLLGLGVDPMSGDETAFRQRHGVGERPYLVCVGRVDDGKGARLLATYFEQYKLRRPGPLALVFVGPVVQPLDPHPDTIVTGPIPEDDKWGALHGAEVLVTPSPYESFSLALVEGWAAGKPALVNAVCVATREHAERSGGGLWFHSYASFEACLDVLLKSSGPSQSLAIAGQQYVDNRFRWPALIERYGEFLEYIVGRTATHTGRSKVTG